MTATTAAATPGLPAAFADLAPFAGWALPGEHARYRKRLASTMDEMQAFYDAMLPRLQAVLDHLEARSMDELTEEDRHLVWLACAFVNVSFPVECWRQPNVPDAGASDIYPVREPAI
jgi:hypothetical protein